MQKRPHRRPLEERLVGVPHARAGAVLGVEDADPLVTRAKVREERVDLDFAELLTEADVLLGGEVDFA